MIEDPAIVQVEDQLTALIPMVFPYREMSAAIGPAIQELIASAQAQGLTRTGPWMAHHLSLSEDILDLEVTIPVSGTFTAVGRAIPGLRPAGEVARASYRGDYPALPAAWDAFRLWIDATGRRRASHIFEVYKVTPPTAPNPADWVTELNWPLLGPLPETRHT